MNKYPNYIMQKVRQNLDLDNENDISKDAEINAMSQSEAFRRVCLWEGFLGEYHDYIKHWIEDIYMIKLDKEF